MRFCYSSKCSGEPEHVQTHQHLCSSHTHNMKLDEGSDQKVGLKPHLLIVHVCSTHLSQQPFYGTSANSAEPNQIPQSVASDQALHCLLT